MAWHNMITARFKIIILLTILVSLSHQSEQPIHISNQNYHGSCASIGYSAKCCPPGESCEASDGNCTCSASCHNKHFNNCCEDVFCHPSNNNIYRIIILSQLMNILQSQEHAKMLDVAIVQLVPQSVIIISMMKMEIRYYAMVFLAVVSSSLLDHA